MKACQGVHGIDGETFVVNESCTVGDDDFNGVTTERVESVAKFSTIREGVEENHDFVFWCVAHNIFQQNDIDGGSDSGELVALIIEKIARQRLDATIAVKQLTAVLRIADTIFFRANDLLATAGCKQLEGTFIDDDGDLSGRIRTVFHQILADLHRTCEDIADFGIVQFVSADERQLTQWHAAGQ